MTRRPCLPAALLAALLAACAPAPAPPADSGIADTWLQRLREAQAVDQHEAAFVYARELIGKYPESAAAATVRSELPQLEAAADAHRERKRLAGLWTYHRVHVEEGYQFTAYMYGQATGEAPELRMVLRRHPEWGQNVYLLIGGGADFACRDKCSVPLAIDAGPDTAIEVSRAPDTDPPALFIEDDAALFAAVETARELRLTVPLADGRDIAYRFEPGGYDPRRMELAPLDTAN
jgi:hypothetical protein